jgi:hypothetical protein
MSEAAANEEDSDTFSTCSELTLTGNRLGTSGCETLGKLLPEWDMLNALKIDACSITDSAAACLARGVNSRTLPRLQHIMIGGNRLGPAGLASLSSAFSSCAVLKSLDISCTPMAAPPTVVPADPDLPEALARLDHERPPRRMASGANGERRLMRSGTNVSEGSAAAAAAMAGSEDGGGASRGFVGTLMVWSKDAVQALAPLLQMAENIKAQRCVWDNEALKVLFNTVSTNPASRTIGVHCLQSRAEPGDAPPPRRVTVAHALQKLQGRAAAGGVADLISISFSGMPAGDLERVLRSSKTAALGSKLKSCVVRCPKDVSVDARIPLQPLAPTPNSGPMQVSPAIIFASLSVLSSGQWHFWWHSSE